MAIPLHPPLLIPKTSTKESSNNILEEEAPMKEKEAKEKLGGSNVGKYKGVKSFAGPSGGAPSGSFPINTPKRAKAALAYAHNAPKPEGIRAAVHRKYPNLGKPKKEN